MRLVPGTRPLSPVRVSLAFCLVAVSLACEAGRDVDLGSLSSPKGSGGRGGGGHGGEATSCSDMPCANFEGEHTFTEPGAPSDAADTFRGASENPAGSSTAEEPTLVYPSHETALPLKLRNLRFEWTPGADNTLFELRFRGQRTTVLVYTRQTAFVANAEAWAWLAESNRGGELQVDVCAVSEATPTLSHRSKTHLLKLSDRAVPGSLYYWSTATAAVMRASLSAGNDVQFYPAHDAAPAGGCVGCHSVSRDGTRLALANAEDRVRIVDLTSGAVLVPAGAGGAVEPVPAKGDKAGVWSTFSPNSQRLLVAADGKLNLLDAGTGAPIGAGLITLPAKSNATHPDWSPDGAHVAFTLTDKPADKNVDNASIAWLPVDGDSFGVPEVLVPSEGAMDNNLFPAFSPDSRFLAYVNTRGKGADSAAATLRLLDLESRVVKELSRLNGRVGELDGVLNLGNSMPSFAPATGDGLYWLAFSSLRAYGSVRPLDPKQDQLWLAALDPSLEDPGYAAFWAPFQSLDQGNHRAQWAANSSAQVCGCQELCGDGVDDDCDGSVDESDCVSAWLDAEVCDDGVDNDGDCVVDACVSEVCDDGVDNDGDGEKDPGDLACRAPP